jgi:hypothetical protein
VLHAAECIGTSVNSIAQTNNHLESHNRHIKGKYFKPFTHGGWLPHLDHWVQTLVIMVIPKFFVKLADERKLLDYQAAMQCGVGAPSSAECESEIKLLLAHVLANTDTKDAHESDSDTKSLDHDNMCDSNLLSSIGSAPVENHTFKS